MSEKKQKSDIKRTCNVIHALMLPCRRRSLEEMAREQPKLYGKLVKKCQAYQTRCDGETLGNRLFFCNPNKPKEVFSLQTYGACFIGPATTTTDNADIDEAALKQSVAASASPPTPLSQFYWRDADESHHPLLRYVKTGDLKLLVTREPVTDLEQAISGIKVLRKTLKKLLDEAKTSTPSKKPKKPKKPKKAKKANKDKKTKKSNKEKAKKKKKRDDSSDESDSSDSDDSSSDDDSYGGAVRRGGIREEEDWSSDDDVSYVPDEDDSEYAGEDYDDGDSSSDDESTVEDAVLEAEEAARKEKRKRKKEAKKEKHEKKDKHEKKSKKKKSKHV
jgi:hypothetical protein